MRNFLRGDRAMQMEIEEKSDVPCICSRFYRKLVLRLRGFEFGNPF